MRSLKLGAAAGVAVAAAAITTLMSAAPAASYTVNYCQAIPSANVPKEAWGYHAGQPITGATGSYSRGHGTLNLSSWKTTGIICQVDRVRNQPDHEIVLSIGSKALYASHNASMFGVAGNVVKLSVTVKNSTDPNCAVKTEGRVTIFASYNGVHADGVNFWFPAACKDHRHNYKGSSVVTNVPPN
ncbi:MAG TPA: hypothetical protein VG410_15300 [Solirubrobacteraceae bacterium]|nr:hypothetical protein [Solirubrobacteraceae bacterium]